MLEGPENVDFFMVAYIITLNGKKCSATLFCDLLVFYTPYNGDDVCRNSSPVHSLHSADLYSASLYSAQFAQCKSLHCKSCTVETCTVQIVHSASLCSVQSAQCTDFIVCTVQDSIVHSCTVHSGKPSAQSAQ